MRAVLRTLYGVEKDKPGKLEGGTMYLATDTGNIFIYDESGFPTIFDGGPTRTEVSKSQSKVNFSTISTIPALNGLSAIDIGTALVNGNQREGVPIMYAIAPPPIGTVAEPEFLAGDGRTFTILKDGVTSTSNNLHVEVGRTVAFAITAGVENSITAIFL